MIIRELEGYEIDVIIEALELLADYKKHGIMKLDTIIDLINYLETLGQ